MRPGLVAVGGALAILGAGILASLYLVPAPAPSNQYSFAEPGLLVPPGSTRSAVLTGIVASSASVTVRWSSTSDLSATLYREPTCPSPPGPCPGPVPVMNWTAAHLGVWATSGPTRFPYLLTWSNPHATPSNVSVAWSESTSAPVQLPVVTVLLVDAGAGVLVAIGGLAVFLGFFLRGGVYRGPAPIVSRSAEDVEPLASPPEPTPPRG